MQLRWCWLNTSWGRQVPQPGVASATRASARKEQACRGKGSKGIQICTPGVVSDPLVMSFWPSGRELRALGSEAAKWVAKQPLEAATLAAGTALGVLLYVLEEGEEGTTEADVPPVAALVPQANAEGQASHTRAAGFNAAKLLSKARTKSTGRSSGGSASTDGWGFYVGLTSPTLGAVGHATAAKRPAPSAAQPAAAAAVAAAEVGLQVPPQDEVSAPESPAESSTMPTAACGRARGATASSATGALSLARSSPRSGASVGSGPPQLNLPQLPSALSHSGASEARGLPPTGSGSFSSASSETRRGVASLASPHSGGMATTPLSAPPSALHIAHPGTPVVLGIVGSDSRGAPRSLQI